MKPKLFVLVGPTASGKTAVACEIAKRLPVELISCDSMQVYKGMPILTQAPPKRTPQLLSHLVSFLNPSQEYNAAKFRKDAESLMQKIYKKKKTPLIAGGTGLYLRMLLDGLFESGAGNSRSMKFRKKLLAEQVKRGGAYLHEKLLAADPASAQKIHPNDFRRLVRALEVYELTGDPISKKKKERKGIREQYDCRIFFLDRERADLYERAHARVEQMLKDGLLKEVKRVSKKRLSKTASVALGLREMRDHLKGNSSFENAVELLKQHTRNYAKRQVSWFKHEKGVTFVPVAKDEAPAKTAEKILQLWEAGPA